MGSAPHLSHRLSIVKIKQSSLEKRKKYAPALRSPPSRDTRGKHGMRDKYGNDVVTSAKIKYRRNETFPPHIVGPSIPAWSGGLPLVTNHSKDMGAVAMKGKGKMSVGEQMASMLSEVFRTVNEHSLNVVERACTRNANEGFKALAHQFRYMMQHQHRSTSSASRSRGPDARRRRPRSRSPSRYRSSAASHDMGYGSSAAQKRKRTPTPTEREDCRARCKCRVPGPPGSSRARAPKGTPGFIAGFPANAYE